MNKENTFHIGLTMAGAVSAGAYTAGFMDYLIEVLELWEKEKKHIRQKLRNNEALTDEEKQIPLHDICIDVIGGASAGGMVSMMTALSTFADMPPITKPPKENIKTGNILYDSWVLLDDDLNKEGGLETFEKMLKTDDFEGTDSGIPSLLNSKPIDHIADRVFDNIPSKEERKPLPSYFSPDLRVLLTLCSLRGVPFELKFKSNFSNKLENIPGHRMREHMVIAHFKLNFNEETDKDVYLKFNPYDPACKSLLKLCTKATGAFPIGLAPRHFKEQLSTEYIKNCIFRNLDIKESEKTLVEIKIDEDFFDFTDVDGGTINNEPYGEVVRVLEEMHQYNSKFPNFGTIMIDPFPNFYKPKEAFSTQTVKPNSTFQNNIWKVIPKLYSTFREQVRVKRNHSFYKDYIRYIVYPKKWKQNESPKDHPPIACAALDGFGGFLDIEFRKHDFFLGRNNARNFFRAIFMLEYKEDSVHPLFKNLRVEALNTFKRVTKDSITKEITHIYVPIIPDLKLIEDKKLDYTNPFYYDYKDFPQIKPGYFKAIEPQMKSRVKSIIKCEIKNRNIKSWVLRNGFKVLTNYASKKITREAIEFIEKDLKNRKMMPK